MPGMAIAKEIKKKKFYYINSQILCELEYKVTFNKEIRDCRRVTSEDFGRRGTQREGSKYFGRKVGILIFDILFSIRDCDLRIENTCKEWGS